MESIHGHDVIHMVQQAEHAFSRAELVTAIQEKFGSGARFHTCSAEGMTAAELVEFLVTRGKFSGPDSALALDASRVCQH
ncbi:MAG: YecH family protein [Verrucomicrobia bacterium]|nr:YecH family protein [Verrucomicrobiota bacterium]